MGIVYRATQLSLARPVAVKLIAPEHAADEGFRERFERESRMAAAIEHPNVIPVYGAGEEDGRLYLVMRWVAGTDLHRLLRSDGRLDPLRATEIVGQVADALDAAHAAGLVHRDVKPANVLLSGEHAYLADFGLTRLAGHDPAITSTGQFLGTVDYMAPEQFRREAVDARADVYALGCVLFEMIAGQPPFRRENEYATMYAHTSDPPPALSSVAAGVTPALDAAVNRALAKDPEQRFQSAGDFARAVAAAVAGETVIEPERTVAVGRAAPPTEVVQSHPIYGYGMDPDTSVLPERRRRTPWLALGIVIAALAVAGAVAAVLASQGSDSGHNSPPPPPPRHDNGPTVQQGVAQIATVLDLSQQGRTLTIDGEYSKAVANRQQVLDRIDALKLNPQLERSRTLLRNAVQASLGADQALLQCTTCASTQAANRRATRLKNAFVLQFNPFATQYLQRSFDANSL
jgi:serine/threonine protein kinase